MKLETLKKKLLTSDQIANLYHQISVEAQILKEGAHNCDLFAIRNTKENINKCIRKLESDEIARAVFRC